MDIDRFIDISALTFFCWKRALTGGETLAVKSDFSTCYNQSIKGQALLIARMS